MCTLEIVVYHLLNAPLLGDYYISHRAHIHSLPVTYVNVAN